ncbi:hypothetical protein HR060_13700 [Catenovulum sp. SM1970]|uniref:hypothetical protein n=1 Tax=Marinifaba aquimaris TaxID=2741323 RepID=UPI001574A631|nr:hypothetical protein [Marinifaba aquimaris]NTS77909.1 hypothetical protein [Marinifaba aquimaris]
MKTYLFIFLLSAFLFPCNAQELIISEHLKAKVGKPASMALSGNLLILKYDDWTFSFENIQPETYVANVNLTGIEHLFIDSLFDTTKRDKLPNWLAIISKELADSVAPKGSSVNIANLGNSKILSSYNHDGQQGFIFILEERLIHKIEVLAKKGRFDNLMDNITQRNL